MALRKRIAAALTALSALCAAPTVSAQFVDSQASVSPNGGPGSVTSGPAQTYVPGELVSSQATDFGIANGAQDTPSIGPVGGSASASSDLGVNRISLATRGAYALSPPNEFPVYSNYAQVIGNVYSYWNDSWVVTGGSPGDTVTVNVQGRTTFSFSAVGPVGPPNFAIEQGVIHNDGQLILAPTNFLANANQGFLDWAVSFNAPVGTSSVFQVYLQARSQPLSDAIFYGSGGTEYLFDAMNTAKLTSVSLPAGYSLTSASGQLVQIGDGYGYIAAVPLPGAAWLMLSGLGVLGAIARRRQSRASA